MARKVPSLDGDRREATTPFQKPELQTQSFVRIYLVSDVGYILPGVGAIIN